jgi:hypothetical protein
LVYPARRRATPQTCTAKFVSAGADFKGVEYGAGQAQIGEREV